jgi:hypothetical protein
MNLTTHQCRVRQTKKGGQKMPPFNKQKVESSSAPFLSNEPAAQHNIQCIFAVFKSILEIDFLCEDSPLWIQRILYIWPEDTVKLVSSFTLRKQKATRQHLL